jgi:hypothetical protein
MLRLIATIVIIFIVSQVVKRAKRQQEEARRRRLRSIATSAKVSHRVEEVEKMSAAQEARKVRVRMERSVGTDDEFRPSVDESIIPDEESSITESVGARRAVPLLSESRDTASGADAKPSTPPKREPVKIAGIPLTHQTISQGIIISEILRRPEF